MRIMLPLALTIATAGACRGAPARTEDTAFQAPARDLTLQPSETPKATIASPVELDRATPTEAARTAVRRPTRRSTTGAAPRPAAPVADVTVASPALAPAPLAIPAAVTTTTADASDPYALEPGETITVLPASTGATASPAGPSRVTDDRPADARGGTDVHVGGGGGGGSCGGRGGGRHPGGFRGLR
jgi:hypothetical protein